MLGACVLAFINENVIQAAVEAQGFRPDRAAAEAVFVVETVGESEYWEAVVKAIQA